MSVTVLEWYQAELEEQGFEVRYDKTSDGRDRARLHRDGVSYSGEGVNKHEALDRAVNAFLHVHGAL